MLDKKEAVNRSVTMCQIGDECKIVQYDEAVTEHNLWSLKDPLSYQYLGRGRIYSVDGVRQPGVDILYFFRKIKSQTRDGEQ